MTITSTVWQVSVRFFFVSSGSVKCAADQCFEWKKTHHNYNNAYLCISQGSRPQLPAPATYLMKVFSLLSRTEIWTISRTRVTAPFITCMAIRAFCTLLYGCGVVFICVQAVQSLSSDKRIAPHFLIVVPRFGVPDKTISNYEIKFKRAFQSRHPFLQSA